MQKSVHEGSLFLIYILCITELFHLWDTVVMIWDLVTCGENYFMLE